MFEAIQAFGKISGIMMIMVIDNNNGERSRRKENRIKYSDKTVTKNHQRRFPDGAKHRDITVKKQCVNDK